MKHKWHKEITAYANGAKIEAREINDPDEWYLDVCPYWDDENLEYRIKQKPKYLYVWQDNLHEIKLTTNTPHPLKEYANINFKCIGKIKLESEE